MTEKMPVFWETVKIPEELKETKTEKRRHKYSKHVAALDVETSATDSAAWVYLWCFAIDDFIVYGRTVNDLKHWLRRLTDFLGLTIDFRMVVYIHNAKYDLQFIKKDISLKSVKKDDFIARSKRQILRCCLEYCFEVRDSAVYSEMPLRMMGAEIGMEKYETDYDEICTPDTPLTPDKIIYCARDTHILTSYFNIQKNLYGGHVSDIPLTATRRVKKVISECFAAHCKETPALRPYIQARQLKTVHQGDRAPTAQQIERYAHDKYILNQLRTAFFGGFCYASYLWCNWDLRAENGLTVYNADIDACYASMMLLRPYPMEKFKPLHVPTNAKEERFMREGRGEYRDMALLIQVKLTNFHSRVPDFAFLPSWIKYQTRKPKGIQTPEGSQRIAAAEEIEIVLTDIDYRQLRRWYTGDEDGRIKIISVLGSRYAWLPEYITDTVIRLYHDKKQEKQTIKKLRAEGTATMQDEIIYRNKKTMLARMYGVFVQDPIRAIYEWDDEKHTVSIPEYTSTETAQYGEVLYMWGVWVAAWARDKLLNMCMLVGTTTDQNDGKRKWNCDIVGCDTDCVRFMRLHDQDMDIFTRDNAETRAQIRQILTPERIERMYRFYGVRYPADTLDGIGEWDLEIYPIYKQIGLKQYIYTDEYGAFHTVVAGLPRADYQTGADGATVNRGMTFFDQFKTIDEKFDAFTRDMIIPAEQTTILRTEYIEDERELDIADCTGETRHVVTSCGVVLVPTAYKARHDYQNDEIYIDVDKLLSEFRKAGIDVDLTDYEKLWYAEPELSR